MNHLMRLWPLMILLIIMAACKARKEHHTGLQGDISISGAFALYPLIIRWSEEFGKMHPGVTFNIQAGGAGKGMTDVLTGTVDLGMISRDIDPEEIRKGAYPFAVAKDAVIPTISTSNPLLQQLFARGVTRNELVGMWVTGQVKKWDQITGSTGLPVRVYTRSDAAGAPETWAKFLGSNQEDLLGVGVFGDPGLAEAVMNEKTAVGYNNISYVYNIYTGKPHEGISPLPLDLDGNGSLDPDEQVYGSLGALNQAIADGVFPAPPARPLYLVCKGEPAGEPLRSFLYWILTEGQAYTEETGFVQLTDSLISTELTKIKN